MNRQAERLTDATKFRRTRNIDVCTLICLDDSGVCSQALAELRTIVDYTLLFTTVDQCLKEINDTQEQTFLIVSHSFHDSIIPEVHRLQQLESIFIFDANATLSQAYLKEYPKIQGIYDDFTKLQRDLENNVKNTFKYKEIIGELFNRDHSGYTMNRCQPPMNSKDEFVALFENYYESNPTNKQQVKQFADEYNPSSAPRWYTMDIFVYRVLNKAMRVGNVQLICAYHFFIRDLYHQIESQYQLSKTKNGLIRTYRGQIINQLELAWMKEAKDLDLRLAVNPFLSTSGAREVASVFIEGYKPENGCAGLMLEIELNAHTTSLPFAPIRGSSHFSDEEEILFAPGAVFTVQSIEYDESNQLHNVRLSLCSDEEIHKRFDLKYALNDGRASMREVFEAFSSSFEIRCSEVDDLYHYVKILFPDDELLEISYLEAKALNIKKKKKFKEAIEFFERSRLLREAVLPHDGKGLAALYCYMAEVYYRLHEDDESISFYKKALALNVLSPSRRVRIHSSLGYSYLRKSKQLPSDNIESANRNFRTALELDAEEDVLFPAERGEICLALAELHVEQDALDIAVSFYQEALEMYKTDGNSNVADQIEAKIQEFQSEMEFRLSQTVDDP